MEHEIYMRRCIELARLAAGHTHTNPMVGCVIVHNGHIIGEGYHRKFGEPHAEVNAIASVTDKSLLRQATLYVNLEPCAHHGKTPPCVDLILAHRIQKVVVGMVDPFEQVSGKGLEKLKNSGVEVVAGILEKECIELNKRFVVYHTQKRPYVILKWAQTLDGYLSPDVNRCTPEEFEQKRHITGFIVQQLVHKWRTHESAIMVGTNTVLSDNPALNNRAWPGCPPLRVVIDREARLASHSHLKIFDGSQPTAIFTHTKDSYLPNKSFDVYPIKHDLPTWPQLFDVLYQRKIVSMIVEGGAMLLNDIIRQNRWDEAQVFVTNKWLQQGIAAPQLSLPPKEVHQVDGSQLYIYRTRS